jgi:hypothetical protein
LKLQQEPKERGNLLDKLNVRKIISEKFGDQYLIPLLGVYSDLKEIVFENLPDSFVIKASHGSGYNVFVEDKKNLERFNILEIKRKFEEWMKNNYAFCNGLDLHYKDIEKKILIEPLLENIARHDNFKVLCFMGKAEVILAETNKNKYGRRNRDLFNRNLGKNRWIMEVSR